MVIADRVNYIWLLKINKLYKKKCVQYNDQIPVGKTAGYNILY